MSLKIGQITTGSWQQHCYIIYNDTYEAIIIDPGSEGEQIVQWIKDKHLNVLAILNTHAHYDHIGAVKVLKDIFSVPFFLNSHDLKLLKRANLYSKVFEGDHIIPIPKVDYYLDHIALPILLGSFSIQPLWTPGHTAGSSCFYIDSNLFVGDTLFHNKIGRTDLPGGNKKSLYKSLNHLSHFPKNTKIYPGHGPFTTIAAELETNNDLRLALQLN